MRFHIQARLRVNVAYSECCAAITIAKRKDFAPIAQRLVSGTSYLEGDDHYSWAMGWLKRFNFLPNKREAKVIAWKLRGVRKWRRSGT